MTATMLAAERITISDQTVNDVRSAPVPRGTSIALISPDGHTVDLPHDVQAMLLGALRSIASNGSVAIGRVPDELTSTVAADLLGVSRPTLMKWVRAGEIDSFTVGTHTRFHRDDVLHLREQRSNARREAFDALRALDMEDDSFLDD